MKLYDKSNISEINICNNKIEYLKNLVNNGLKFYIDNCYAQILIMKCDEIYFPLIICDYAEKQTYLASLISSYIDYPKQMLNNKFFFLGFDILKKILKFGNFDKVVYINHWLISTNVQYSFSDEQIAKITKFLKNKFPNHALSFRNIAQERNEIIFKSLKKNNYKFLINRRSYFIDKNNFDTVYKKSSLKRDMRLYKKGKYKFSYNNKQWEKYTDLYRSLYIEKYTELNPIYNKNFFKLCSSLFDFKNLSDNKNDIVGIYIPITFGDTIVAPCLGYDRTFDPEEGLYRLLILNVINYAKQHNCSINLSSGVGDFKQKRGAQPYWEYLAIYYSHLNIFRKLSYFLFIEITNKISFYLLKKFNSKLF